MNKLLILIISTILAISIGVFHILRINESYFSKESEPYIVEEMIHLPQAFMMPPQGMMLDSSGVPITEPPQADNNISGSTTFTPSDRALEAKFWMDSIGSFLTTVSPFVVPFIIYRKKEKGVVEIQS